MFGVIAADPARLGWLGVKVVEAPARNHQIESGEYRAAAHRIIQLADRDDG